MSDLDFRHSVSEVPAGGTLPELKRSVSVQTTQGPDVQGAASAYAANTNWMSSLGSAVAQKSSNAIAAKIGGEMGKNPHGDLGPSFTEFDEQLKESYAAQAHSTLSLQAQKLITSSNMELAAAPRLSAGMIENKQNQVYRGLQKIYSMAPDKIRPNFELQYGSVMLNQNEQLQNRMLREQKEDRINTLNSATKQYTQNVYSLELGGVGLDKKGNSQGALAAFEAIKKTQNAAAARHDKTQEEADVIIDGARQAMLSGRITREGLQAEKNGKLGEYERSLADNPEKHGLNAQDHAPVLNNFMTYMNNQKALRSEDENLKMQLMHNKIATDPMNISDTDWQNFASQVSPLKAEQMRFNLIQAMKSKNSENDGMAALMQGYNTAEAQANASPKIKDAVHNRFVDGTMRENPGMSHDDASAQVAASAGAPAPVFTQTLKNALWSGDAAQMVAKAQMIDKLEGDGNGHALTGLSAEDLALASDIAHNNNPQDPSWAARMITENKENQDPKIRAASQTALDNYIHENTVKAGVAQDDFILTQAGIGGGMFQPGFDSPWMKGTYASDIASVFSQAYINSRRDANRAWEITKNHVKNNYGETKINGKSEWTKHPIEKALGFAEGEGLVSINRDIIRQTAIPMQELKTKFDEGKTDHYWSVEPLPTGKDITGHIKSSMSLNPQSFARNLVANKADVTQRLQFVKHSREGRSEKTEKYPLKLVGNSFNWELNIQTSEGIRSVFLEAPEIGVHRYSPDKQWIQDDHMGNHFFPKEKVQHMVEMMTNPGAK